MTGSSPFYSNNSFVYVNVSVVSTRSEHEITITPTVTSDAFPHKSDLLFFLEQFDSVSESVLIRPKIYDPPRWYANGSHF